MSVSSLEDNSKQTTTENSSASLGQAVANNQAIDLNENNQLDTVPFAKDIGRVSGSTELVEKG